MSELQIVYIATKLAQSIYSLNGVHGNITSQTVFLHFDEAAGAEFPYTVRLQDVDPKPVLEDQISSNYSAQYLLGSVLAGEQVEHIA